MPLAWIERASSSRASSLKRVRGWYGLGSTKSMSSSCGPWWAGSRAGAAAAPPVVATADGCGLSTAGTEGSGSRMSAPSPRPKAFLGIGNDLLGELRVALGPFAVYVVENNRFTKTWRFRQAHVAWYHALEYLGTKKAAEIGRYLPR